MPSQKSQATVQRRLFVLDAIQRLSGRSQRWVTGSEITTYLKKQGYSAKIHSIRRDLKALLETHLQLECNDNCRGDKEPKNGLAYGYRWTSSDKPESGGITLTEALSLVMVERYLSHTLPVLLIDALQDIFHQAHQTLELHKKSQMTHWPEKFCVIPSSQPLIPPELDHEILAVVHEALLFEKQLKVTYQVPNRKEAKTYRLHPLGIIQRGPVTYLAAMANDYENVFLYALHRMQMAVKLEQDCRIKIGFTLAEFAEQQGHFGSGNIIHFKAIICDHLASILEETRLSNGQAITADNNSGYREITADVADTWQLRWWILGEGDRIEVLEPETLRQEIAESFSKCNQTYLR